MFRLLVLVIVIPGMLRAQSDDLFEKACVHYDKKEDREALYFLRKVIAKQPRYAEAIRMRGNCFLAINQADSALLDYERALKLAPHMESIYWGLSIIYWEKKDRVNEEKYLRLFLKGRPDDTDALIRLGHLIADDKPDSGLLLIKKAWSLSPNELETNEALIGEYFHRRRFQDAHELCKKARLNFLHHFEFIEYQAYAAFCMGRFDESYFLADTLNQMKRHVKYQALKVKSDILRKTRPEVYTQNDYTFRFNRINNMATETLDQWVSNSNHPYHYETLLARHRNKETLGLDEYFMLYYGFTTDSRYSPYSSDRGSLDELMKNEKYDQAITEAGNMLSKDEFNLRVIEALMYSQGELQHPDYENSLRLYLGLMEGIIATGSGTSYKEAWIVIAPSHEYDILSYNGLSSGMQALHNHAGHSYDLLSTRIEGEEKQDYFFNIDKPFGSLSKTFRSEHDSEPQKKKGRKKAK